MKNIVNDLRSDMKLNGYHRSLNDAINLTKSQYNIYRENIHVFTIVRNWVKNSKFVQKKRN